MTGAQPLGGSGGTSCRLLIVRALRGAAFVAVVQTTEVGNRDDRAVTRRRDGS